MADLAAHANVTNGRVRLTSFGTDCLMKSGRIATRFSFRIAPPAFFSLPAVCQEENF